MTALPARLVIGPEMMDFGLSVASVALAEGSEEVSLALSELWKAIENARTSFDNVLRLSTDIDGAVSQASGEEIRLFMENILLAETKNTEGEKKLSALIARPKFQSIILQTDVGYDVDDLSSFIEEWRTVYIPFLRKLRLIAISTIFKRISDGGVAEARLDDEFPEVFLSYSLKESEAWQETAHLLASSKTASRLLSSTHGETADRTDVLAKSEH